MMGILAGIANPTCGLCWVSLTCLLIGLLAGIATRDY